jgi:hypothetical protein
MSNIQLIRVVEPMPIMREGRGRIEDRDAHVGIHIVGPDGQEVSIAFDGRSDCYHEAGSQRREEYVTYADNPIRSFHGGCNGPVDDTDTLRILRDALIAMDLGDFDDSVACYECGDRFVPADPVNRGHINYCPDCQDKDYCGGCGGYAILDDNDNCALCSGRNE